MKPWTYDQACVPIPWRMHEVEAEYSRRPIRWAVLRDDGVVRPTPPCERALSEATEALKRRGDDVFEVSPEQLPTHPKDILRLSAHLLNSDGGKTFLSHFRSFFETNDPGASELACFFALPRWLKWVYVKWVRYVQRDEMWADLVDGWSEKTVQQQWKLVAEREMHRNAWFEWAKENVGTHHFCIHATNSNELMA